MRRQQQLLLGIVSVFLVGLGAGYGISWLFAPPKTSPAANPALARSTATGTASAATQLATEPSEVVRVVKNVIDGVTLEVEGEGTIKLAAIDLPPYTPGDNSDPTRRDAPTYLKTELLNQPVRLERVQRPSGVLYFVYAPSGIQVNLDMVRRGLAYASKAGEGSHGDALRQAMSEAIRNGSGLWKVGNQPGNTAATTPPGPASSPGARPGLTGLDQPSGPLHGRGPSGPQAPDRPRRNELEVATVPGSTLYHRVDCPEAKGSVIKMYLSEARNSGLKPDSRCFTSSIMRVP